MKRLLGAVLLVAMEPKSNYIVLEQAAQGRDQDTWNALMERALAGVSCHVIQSTSDEAPGLLTYVEHYRRAHDVPEFEVTWSRHHQGTCRMGNDPKYSVVNRNLRVHDTQNLYVGSCEIFVNSGAMQPRLTIMPLAYHMADHIYDRIKSG